MTSLRCAARSSSQRSARSFCSSCGAEPASHHDRQELHLQPSLRTFAFVTLEAGSGPCGASVADGAPACVTMGYRDADVLLRTAP